jgi:hypothetical protein
MSVTLKLTDEQVAELTRAATDAHALHALLAGADDRDQLAETIQANYNDPRVSRSLLRGLAVLAAVPADGGERDLKSIANEVGLSKSTTHRYLTTWVRLGNLEQSPNSRAYRHTRLVVDHG